MTPRLVAVARIGPAAGFQQWMQQTGEQEVGRMAAEAQRYATELRQELAPPPQQ